MENLVFTQLSIPEVRQIFRQELINFFAENPKAAISEKEQKPLNIKEAADLLNLKVPTVYSLVGRKEIPYSKKGKKLYFDKEELTNWVQSGRKRTVSEIQQEAINTIGNSKRGGTKHA